MKKSSAMFKKVVFPIMVVLLISVFTVFSSAWATTRSFTKEVISAGDYHTVAIKSDGTLWAWGYNGSGQLGDGTNTSKNTPVKVGSDNKWVMVSAGGNHTVAIKADGTLWAWGYNGSGQLGDGTGIAKNTPVQVGSDHKWVMVSAGWDHTVALKADGTLWAWGDNGSGKLGDGTYIGRNTPVQVLSYGPGYVMVLAGYSHTVAITTNGILWAWGDNSSGQLGIGNNIGSNIPEPVVGSDNIGKWVMVEAGDYHTVAIKSDGTLWAWGYNGFGQLGDGTYINRNTPVKVGNDNKWVMLAAGEYHTVAIKSDGTLWAWGRDDKGQLGTGVIHFPRENPVQVGSDNIGKWVMVSAGGNHTVAKKSDGTLWAWGDNYSGQLGDGTNSNKDTPVQVGSDNIGKWVMVSAGGDHTVAKKSDGTLWAWGYNGSGQLGDGTLIDRSTPVQEGIHDNKWVMVSAGGDHTVAITSYGTMWPWGLNNYGQLGDGTNINGNSPSVQVGGSENKWVTVSAGGFHTVAVKSNGTLWAWGYNGSGQLGDGTSTNKNTPVQEGTPDNKWVMVSAGGNHTVAKKSDGTLWAWGDNGSGQLGDGTNYTKNTPVQVGDNKSWVMVSAGYSHTVAIKSDGTLWAWGRNSTGQLGDGTYSNKNTPVKVGNDNNWVMVSAGGLHTVAIKSDGTLWAWGDNGSGQLGDGTYSNKNTPVKVGNDNNWVMVSAGYSHTVAIKSDGTLWAWGYNGSGQLGDGTNANKYNPVPIPFTGTPSATTNSATSITTTSATLNGTVNPNGSSTTAYFQWGTSTSYGNNTSSQSIGSGTSNVNVSASITGLSAGTTYHYRAVATNSAGTTYGSDMTFATTSTGGFSASGTVATSGGTGISGVTMSFSIVSGSGTLPTLVQTGTNGNWNQSGFQSGTTYRVTPSKTGYTFSPTYRDFSSANTGLNFTGTQGGGTQPDLVVSSLSVSSQGRKGSKIHISAKVTNQGTANAVAYRLGFYLSLDSTIITGDYFTAYCNMSPLASGASQTCRGMVTIPTALTSGNYYFGAIADDTNAVTESNETNNTKSSVIRIY